jgi:hypothetical protein
MSLTKEDIQQIGHIVQQEVKSEFERVIPNLVTRNEFYETVSTLATKDDIDRMEGRITSTVSLLERDIYSRFDDYDRRLTRLEKAIIK